MNRLEVQSRVDSKSNEIVTELIVDGQLLPDFKMDSLTVDLCALEQATRESGKFTIVTCICGYPNCAGIKQRIRIEHAGGCVRWRGRILDEEQTFAFDLGEFQAAVERGIEQVRQLMVRHELEVAPAVNKLVFGEADKTEE